MRGCPLSKNKVEGNCATCPQVNDCVFLGIAKQLDELKLHIRDLEKAINKLSK